MKLITSLIVIGLIASNEIYTPAPLVKKDDVRLGNIEKYNTTKLSSYSKLPGRQKNYLEDVFKQRTEFYKERVSSGYFIIDSDIERYCNNLFQQILKANPQLDNKTQLFISRSEEPNAFNTGDGNIVLNLGLLDKLENDAQLAFVIAHEMAHQHLEHVNKSMELKAAKYTDKTFVRAVKKTSKEEYNSNAKLESLILPLIYGDKKFSRNDELQADSVGAMFLINTGYSYKEIVKVLGLFKDIDKYHDKNPLVLQDYFKDKKIESKEYWFSRDHKSSLGDFEEEKDSLEDSLKTHPNTEIRIAEMEKIVTGVKNSEKIYSTNADDYNAFRLHATEELMFANFLWGDLARSMYEGFIHSGKHPDDDYSNTILSLCFSRLHHLQKTHKVGLEVPLPNPKYFEESYNDLIDFVNEVRMEETLALSSQYLPKKEYENSELYFAAKTYNAYIVKGSVYSAYRDEYLKKYPNGWFHKLFTNLIKSNK